MNRYIDGKLVTQIMEDHATVLEAIVRQNPFPPRVMNPSHLFKEITKTDGQIVNYDLQRFYLAMIYYLKVQLGPAANKDDLKHIEYTHGYHLFHIDQQRDELTNSEYEEQLIHQYEKTVLKYLFMVQLLASEYDEGLMSIKNAVISMTDETLCKLGYVLQLSNFKTPVTGPFSKKLYERVNYYIETDGFTAV